jgi:GH25 family lysozyme M1 (1,4-beta-N-acetylmuramidase)/LysM repeat protein
MVAQLKIIDISSHQSIETAGMDGIDGVIVKTTQGTHYVNPKGDPQYQLAKKKGRLLGFYHYAEGTDPVSEANFFVDKSLGYFKEGIPCLDWESGENSSWGDPNWCRKFVNQVHARTGVWCMVYVQASAVNQVANLVNDCPLWVAGYPTDNASWDVPPFNYNIAPWHVYTLWQFTSGGGLDRNVANIDAAAWKRIANPGNTEKPTPPKPTPVPPSKYNTTGKNLETMASDVQSGKVGDGDTRKSNLGKYFTGVQAIVNERAKANSADQTHAILTEETKAGKYGNGDERKHMLGNYYDVVQSRINGKTNQRVYTVVAGDSLSGIGATLGVPWIQLAQMNNIYAPYIIQVGQTIKY